MVVGLGRPSCSTCRSVQVSQAARVGAGFNTQKLMFADSHMAKPSRKVFRLE